MGTVEGGVEEIGDSDVGRESSDMKTRCEFAGESLHQSNTLDTETERNCVLVKIFSIVYRRVEEADTLNTSMTLIGTGKDHGFGIAHRDIFPRHRKIRGGPRVAK
jgi:hypothetical protein